MDVIRTELQGLEICNFLDQLQMQNWNHWLHYFPYDSENCPFIAITIKPPLSNKPFGYIISYE